MKKDFKVSLTFFFLRLWLITSMICRGYLLAQEIDRFNFEVKVTRKDGSSTPIANAKVVVFYEDNPYLKTTDGGGSAVIKLPIKAKNSLVDVFISAEGYLPVSKTLSATSPKIVQLESAPKSTVTNQPIDRAKSTLKEETNYFVVKVRNKATNEPLEGVEINIDDIPEPKEPLFFQPPKTGSDGITFFQYPSKYFGKPTRLRATKAGYSPEERTINLLYRSQIALQSIDTTTAPPSKPKVEKPPIKKILFLNEKDRKPIRHVDIKVTFNNQSKNKFSVKTDSLGLCSLSIPDSLFKYTAAVQAKADGYKSYEASNFNLNSITESSTILLKKKGIPWYVWVGGAIVAAGAGYEIWRLLGSSSEPEPEPTPTPTAKADSVWHFLGPEGGWFRKVIAAKSDPNVAFAISRNGKIYKTIDGGSSWSLLTTIPAWVKNDVLYDLVLSSGASNLMLLVGLNQLGLSNDGGVNWTTKPIRWPDEGHAFAHSIAIAPNDLYWIAYDDHYDLSKNLRPFKSTDQGTAWVKADSGYPIGKLTSQILISRRNSNIVLAATQAGLYRSTNAGASWRKVYPKNNSEINFRCLAESMDGIFYAGKDPISASDTSGIYSSSDNGLTWQFDSGSFTLNYAFVYDLETHPFLPAYCLAAIPPNYGIGRRKESILWQPINTGLEYLSDAANAKYHWIQSIAISSIGQNREGTAYAASANGAMYKTELSNPQWRQVATGLRGMPIRSLDVRSDGTLLAGSDGSGLFFSKDFGSTWQKSFDLIQNYEVINYLSVSIPAILAPPNDTLFIAGMDGNTIRNALFVIDVSRLSSNRVTKFFTSDVYSEMDLITSIIRINSTKELVLSLDDAVSSGAKTLFRTGIAKRKAGLGWMQVLSNVNVSTIAQNPKNDRHLLVGVKSKTSNNYAIYESRDGGDSWQEKGVSIDKKIKTITFAPNDNSKVLIGTDESVYKIVTNSLARVQIADVNVNKILFDPRDDRIVYVGAGDHFDSGARGFFISTDGGENFSPEITGLQDLHVLSMAFYPSKPDTIFIGTGDGVYRRSFDLYKKLNGQANTMQASTAVSSKQLESSHPLITAYPNPFNPDVSIAFWLPKTGRMSIYIYNQLGQNVFVLCDDQIFSEGNHTLRWDGKTSLGTLAASGVYFVKLRFEDEIKVLKLLRMK